MRVMIFIAVKFKISERFQENSCYFFFQCSRKQNRQNNKDKTGSSLEQAEWNSFNFAWALLCPIYCTKLRIKSSYVQQLVFNQGVLLAHGM